MQRRGFLVPLFAAALLHAMFLYCSRVRVRIAIPRNSKPIDSDLPWVRTRTVLCFALLTLYQPRDTASRSKPKACTCDESSTTTSRQKLQRLVRVRIRHQKFAGKLGCCGGVSIDNATGDAGGFRILCWF